MIICKKNILQFLLMFCIYALQAQVQTNPPMRQVLSTTGSSATLPSGITIDYTVGECMVNTYASASPSLVKIITQGFEQPTTANDTTRKNIPPLKFYSGFTPNKDGNNDNWQIDGITKFPNNTVSIFNRWGEKVWHTTKYDNIEVVWDGTSYMGQLLPDATYFYVIEADGKTYKGWVELTK